MNIITACRSIFTPRVSRGCNSFDTVCEFVCLSVSLSRPNGQTHGPNFWHGAWWRSSERTSRSSFKGHRSKVKVTQEATGTDAGLHPPLHQMQRWMHGASKACIRITSWLLAWKYIYNSYFPSFFWLEVMIHSTPYMNGRATSTTRGVFQAYVVFLKYTFIFVKKILATMTIFLILTQLLSLQKM